MEKRNVIILGSGVAGLTAGIYNGRAELKPLILSGKEDGGQIGTTTMVDNFPGFPDGILGPDLVMNMKKQAEKFGAETRYEVANSFSPLDDQTYKIVTDSNEYIAKSVIIATGASARWLNLPDEEKFRSRGVHTCATCDGAFYKDKNIIVVGGGDAACEEANFLTKFAKEVTMLIRKEAMRASVPMQERVQSNPKIKFSYNSSISGYTGDEKGLNGVMVKNNKTGKEEHWDIDGVFLAIGHKPNTDIFKEHLELDEIGYLKVQNTKTKLPGVFAAGDVADKMFRQAISAAGTGCAAAINVERYLAKKE